MTTRKYLAADRAACFRLMENRGNHNQSRKQMYTDPGAAGVDAKTLDRLQLLRLVDTPSNGLVRLSGLGVKLAAEVKRLNEVSA